MSARCNRHCAWILAIAFIAPLHAACDDASTPASRYEIKGDEVRDKQSGLVWKRCSVGQHWKNDTGCTGVIRQMTWSDAMHLQLSGWTLPTKEELSTLIAATCKNPAINERIFPDMELTKLWYWTRSEDGASAWYVAFGGGSVRSGGRTELNAVRMVRSGK